MKKTLCIVFFCLGIFSCQGKGEIMDTAAENSFNYAYWLNPENEYVFLLILKMPVEMFPKGKSAPVNDLMEAEGIFIITYGKDSIWNTDMKPFKQVLSCSFIDKKENKVRINNETYIYEKAGMSDIISLFENPEGTIPIHRIYWPVMGMEEFHKKILKHLKTQ